MPSYNDQLRISQPPGRTKPATKTRTTAAWLANARQLLRQGGSAAAPCWRWPPSLAAAARRAATSPGLQLALLLLPCGHQHSHQPKPYLVVRRLAEPCVPCQRLLLRPCWEALDAGSKVPVLVSQAVRSSSRHDNVLQQQPLHTAQHSTAHVDITQCVVSG